LVEEPSVAQAASPNAAAVMVCGPSAPLTWTLRCLKP
jgi:hypothetical protein